MSRLRKSLEEYLALRRSLGYRLRSFDRPLHDFVSFLEQKDVSHITTALTLQWAKQPEDAQPSYWAWRLSMVRGFAEYYRASDPQTEVPPQGLLPYCYRRKNPYIYSDSEIKQLLKGAQKLKSATGLRPVTVAALFGLLAVTGMRVSEAISLDRDDVNLVEGELTIRKTKSRKSRLIPIHRSTQQILHQYAHKRDRLCPRPQSSHFFISDSGTDVSQWAIRAAFIRVSRQIGLRGPTDSHGPRLHDLRHRFAVRTLLNWYQTGIDVEANLPTLAAYLGHTHVADTYWYLTGTPQLLKVVAQRLYLPEGGSLL